MNMYKPTLSLTLCLIPLLSISLSASPVKATTITFEAPGKVSALSAVGTTTQVDFNSLNPGQQGYNYTYNDVSGINVRANYDIVNVYGYPGGSTTAGADNTKFISQFSSGAPDSTNVATTTLSFTNTADNSSVGINYFGMFWSSLDVGNQLQFYNGNTLLNTLNITNIPALLGNNTSFIGGPYNQYSAFFNFYADNNLSFTRIVFTETLVNNGFESDNHTFRIPDALVRTGTPVTNGLTGVPEPSLMVPMVSLMACFFALSVYKKRVLG
ncbi:MAG: hypothetical protein H7Y37_02045 [Anaerolineae bacterium]|nr:hypothetical protein [Gloeobacterales cyanobacterium ES-bin-313]